VLKGEFQRANVKRTKCAEVLKGKLLTIQAVRAIETSPEKAGVGGSTPSLATIISILTTNRALLECPQKPDSLTIN